KIRTATSPAETSGQPSPMSWRVTGKLVTATGAATNFTGCRVEAFFGRGIPGALPSAQDPEVRLSATAFRRSRSEVEGAVEGSGQPAVSLTPPSAPETNPFSVSAVTDATGNFTLAFPDRQEIGSPTVKFVVSSAAGKTVREIEIETSGLLKPIVIDVPPFG